MMLRGMRDRHRAEICRMARVVMMIVMTLMMVVKTSIVNHGNICKYGGHVDYDNE